MTYFAPLTIALLVLTYLAACEANTPGFSSDVLEVEGVVMEAGLPPAPSLTVNIQAWPDPGSGASDSLTTNTDALGQYTAVLGPFPNGHVDSLHVRVTQNDCGLERTTELRRGEVEPSQSGLVLPTLALSYRLRSAEFGLGSQMCGAIVTATTAETIGDYARLALWIDDVSDSVRGRWRLNHSATTADDYGYFSGSEEPGGLILQLQPTPPTSCTGLQLQVPVGGDNGVTVGAGTLTSEGNCFVPDTTVRFFEGAELSEVLPPLATGD